MRRRIARQPMALPLAVALAGHGMAAAMLLATPPRHLPPAAEPLAVAVLAEAAPIPALSPGIADLAEPSPPGPVTWPNASPAAPAATPRPAAPGPPRPSVSTTTAQTPRAPPFQAAPSADAINAWRAALSDWVERHRRYPPAARFRDEEGVVLLRFDLDPAGSVLRVILEKGSGSAVLDAAALALLVGASLPSPPPGLPPDQRSVSLPIRYRLR